MEGKKILFAFIDSIETLLAFQKLNFTYQIDDAINKVYYVEADLTDYDWMAVLSLLEDCKQFDLEVTLQFGEELIDWEDAIDFADRKAFEEQPNW